MVENDNPQYRILVGGTEVATVTRSKVEIEDEKVYNVHVFGGPGWKQLIQSQNIVPGTRMVFTNLWNNRLSLMVFDGDGFGTRHEVVQRMELNYLKPFVKSPVETKGMLRKILLLSIHRYLLNFKV